MILSFGHWLGSVGVQHLVCDLDLTVDFAAITLAFKIFSGLYLGICKV